MRARARLRFAGLTKSACLRRTNEKITSNWHNGTSFPAAAAAAAPPERKHRARNDERRDSRASRLFCTLALSRRHWPSLPLPSPPPDFREVTDSRIEGGLGARGSVENRVPLETETSAGRGRGHHVYQRIVARKGRHDRFPIEGTNFCTRTRARAGIIANARRDEARAQRAEIRIRRSRARN